MVDVTFKYGDASITVGFEDSSEATPAGGQNLTVAACNALEDVTVTVNSTAKVYYSSIENNQNVAPVNINNVGLEAASKAVEKALNNKIAELVGQALASLSCPETCKDFPFFIHERIPPLTKTPPEYQAPY